MSGLVLEASKMLEALDESKIKMVISYIGTLTSSENTDVSKRIGLMEGKLPDITVEELNWCNDEISSMFNDGEI